MDERLLVRSIIKTGNIARRYMDRQVEGSGVDLSGGVMGILGYLTHHPDVVVYQKDLEERFSLARSTVSGLLRQMEGDGLIRRESVPGDARLKRVMLTEKAWQLHGRIWEEMKALEEAMGESLSPSEREQFLEYLDRVTENLRRREKLPGGCCETLEDKERQGGG